MEVTRGMGGEPGVAHSEGGECGGQLIRVQQVRAERALAPSFSHCQYLSVPQY